MEREVLGSWREMARGLGQRVLSEGRGGFWKGFLKNRGWGVFDVRGVYKHVMRVSKISNEIKGLLIGIISNISK